MLILRNIEVTKKAQNSCSVCVCVCLDNHVQFIYVTHTAAAKMRGSVGEGRGPMTLLTPLCFSCSNTANPEELQVHR